MECKRYLFSEELMNEGQKYFNKLCKREVSLEETESWLDSLASLYLIFTEMLSHRKYGK